jgi:hypothetical protein
MVMGMHCSFLGPLPRYFGTSVLHRCLVTLYLTMQKIVLKTSGLKNMVYLVICFVQLILTFLASTAMLNSTSQA